MAGDIILLVEDDPVDEELALMALKPYHAEVKVVVARDGVEAVNYLFSKCMEGPEGQENLPKVVFLDLKLPRLNGFDVLKRIRSNPCTQLIPVVVLSSSDEESDIRTSYHLGANSYICKPVDYKQFADSIKRIGLYWSVLNQSPI